MQLKIGRKKELNHIVVDDGKNNISGEHCILERFPNGTFLLKDTSTNGTFVNGQKIAEKQVTAQDKVTLYNVSIDIERLMALFKGQLPQGMPYEKVPIPTPTFTPEEIAKIKKGFQNLKNIYEQNEAKKAQIQKSFAKKNANKRLMITVTGGIITVSLGIYGYVESSQITGIIAGAVGTGTMAINTMIVPDQTEVSEQMKKLNDEFIEIWKCPNHKCNTMLPLGASYKMLEIQSKCNMCKCEWV